MAKAPKQGEEDLVSAAEVARNNGVGRSTVTNWRKQNADFPEPRGGTEARPLYSRKEIKDWLNQYSLKIRGSHGKTSSPSEETRPLSIRLTEVERSLIDAAAAKHEVDTAPWARKHLLNLAKHGDDGMFIPLNRLERAYVGLRAAEANLPVNDWVRETLLGDIKQTIGGERKPSPVS